MLECFYKLDKSLGFHLLPPSGVAFQKTSPEDLAISFRSKKFNSRNFSENELHEVSERMCYTDLKNLYYTYTYIIQFDTCDSDS